MKIRIAARKSDLARLQAFDVANHLRAASDGQVDSQIEIDFQFSQSLGDKNLDAPLWQMPEKGVFTRDLQEDLIQNRCDLVVHSWKDLPVEGFKETEVFATLERQDQRDLLFFKPQRLAALQEASVALVRIFSSSPRRAFNLGRSLPNLLPIKNSKIEFHPIRGNVGTRVRKFLESDFEGLIVASAAIHRLLNPPLGSDPEILAASHDLRSVLKGLLWMYLPLKENPTAAAQGALAIEIRRNDLPLKKLLAKINHVSTFENAQGEREILSAYGGGCHQKLGISILTRSFGRVLSVQGESPDGNFLERWEILKAAETPIKASPSELWPQSPSEATFFDRESIFLKKPSDKNAFFVSRSEALPVHWSLDPLKEYLWVSGAKTWKSLAHRGLWVHGSSEGLGEDFPHLPLAPNLTIKWVKLTHEESAQINESEGTPAMAGYRLIKKDLKTLSDFGNRKHYFWMSASGFYRALELDPSIIKAEHSCGPGNTYRLLSKLVKTHQLKLRVALDYESWKKSLLG
jgi:hydroxymethylbilane synthase